MQRGKGNLPFDVSSFVGRVDETNELRAALSSGRLVSVTGVGGAGKSRLAVHVARKMSGGQPDGTWLIELDDLEDETLLPHTIMSTLGVPEESGRPTEESLLEWLAPKRLLIVLDNCEHLVEACGRLVTEFLVRAPGLRILATSREVLGVPGEVAWPIPSLSVPGPEATIAPAALSQYEAPVLFEQRARAVLSSFTITAENAQVVAELCRRLDGSPLALELAAVQLRALTLGEVLNRLDRPFAMLRVAGPETSSRRHSLRAVVDGSYELCSAAERRIWASSSVFAGGFDLQAAEEVCTNAVPDEDVLLGLRGLVDKSLLVVSQQAETTRFRMLETIRRYGGEKLAEFDDEARVRRRHRDHYLSVVERAEQDWSGPRQPERLAHLRQERSNLWTALDFSFSHPGEQATGVRIAGLLWPLWIVGGLLKEGRHWIDRALAVGVDADLDRARTAAVGALLACLEGDVPRARALLDDSHPQRAAVDDPALLAILARAAGTVEMLDGNLDAARPWFEQAVRLLENARTSHSLALVSYADLGVVLGLSGAVEQGVARCEEGRELCQAQGETWALSWILFVLSFLRLVQNENEDVRSDLENMLRIKVAFNDVLGILQAAELLAWVAVAHGDPRRAARILGSNEALWRPLGAYLLSFGPYLARHEWCLVQARAALGNEAFKKELREGAGMDLKQLAAFALNEAVEEEHRAPSPRDDHVLTPREREICGLVAEGLTDKQIAERLTLSPRTVQTHVANILSKLAFRSRAQIAAWASGQP
ncbi:MAG: LuxR C-terminal-related transcriptional regulator [Actinomycetota bacterium]|nr:LuxR C-terminal-related transcriptional regulator [Actinomycetota bacterium]